MEDCRESEGSIGMNKEKPRSQEAAGKSSRLETGTVNTGRDGRGLPPVNGRGNFSPIDKYSDNHHMVGGRVPRHYRFDRY